MEAGRRPGRCAALQGRLCGWALTGLGWGDSVGVSCRVVIWWHAGGFESPPEGRGLPASSKSVRKAPPTPAAARAAQIDIVGCIDNMVDATSGLHFGAQCEVVGEVVPVVGMPVHHRSLH